MLSYGDRIDNMSKSTGSFEVTKEVHKVHFDLK